MRRLYAGLLVLAAWYLGALASAQTPTKVETTTYTYNRDGAVTRILEQVTENGLVGTPTVTYFTWDNCTPDEQDPTTCTLHPANGNLLGYGPAPGDDTLWQWSAHYDGLDRMTQATNAQQQTAVYRYHPDELLAASLNANASSSDGLQFYCDQSRYPQVTNIYDRHTGTLSARHAGIRYVDGRQQLLVRHRKDTDGVYDPIGQTMEAYRYDPYGAGGVVNAPMASLGSTGPLYSVETNPFQYSAELRDPVSGADYLRARWYLPKHQTFLQRDPARNLNRYGYANGNPIMNHDPRGTSAEKFFKNLAIGMMSSVTLGIVPIVHSITSDPKGFWKHGAFWLSVDMTLLTVATAALEMRLAGRFVGVTGGFRRLQVLGGLIMTGESAVQGVRDKDFVDGFGAQMLGGALGGAPWTVLETGLAGARARWNEDSVYQTWLDDHNTMKGELTSVELNWADVTTVSLHDSEKYWNDLNASFPEPKDSDGSSLIGGKVRRNFLPAKTVEFDQNDYPLYSKDGKKILTLHDVSGLDIGPGKLPNRILRSNFEKTMQEINSGKDFDAARKFRLRMLRDLNANVLRYGGTAPQ